MSSKSKPSLPKSNTKAPRVFISYAHENAQHKHWVRRLAYDLRENGVDAILDQWECKLGSDLTSFMEKGISTSDRVLLVCTPVYKKKTTQGKGGVGYERLVVTGEIAKNILTEKFICVLRQGTDSKSIPIFAKTRLFIDFRRNQEYKERLNDLLRDIHTSPTHPKPTVGPNPFSKEKVQVKRFKKTKQKTVTIKPKIGFDPLAHAMKQYAIEQDKIPLRRRLTDTRTALTHRFHIAGHEGLITVGLFEDAQPGEVQITMEKNTATVTGLLESVSKLITMGLQYGIPLESLVKEFENQRFEPNGSTKNPEIQHASSVLDYAFRWMALQFIPGYRETTMPTRALPELALPGLLEEMKKKINRPVPELPASSKNRGRIIGRVIGSSKLPSDYKFPLR
jgi:hypothetical protein